VIITMEPGAVVTCTPEEEAIFATLLDVVKTYDLPVTLRVAGGWVRDKLLGKNSTDIDVALDCMMGEEFAVKVNEYLAARGEETHGVGVIQSNPDQSKHLETATMRVHGVWLDLVNLRCESYTEGSRIPRAEFGTAEDDAARRDLTINSLFYNINERKVEDFTGKGLDDLQAGVVRTPLPPLETFTDDPLRILRSVRFASRFGFSLDDAIARAATNPEVQTKLRLKVSRERVGKEVQSMLRGPSPGDALTLLCRFGLYDVVFASGSTPAAAGDLAASLPTAAPWGCLHAARCLDAVLSAHANLRSEPSFYTKTLTAEERECLVLASFLSPLHDGWVANPRGAARGSSPVRLGSKRTKHVPIVREIIKEGLKLRGKDADAVCTILDVAGVMREAFFEHAEKPSEAASEASSTSEGLSSEAREYASPLPSRVVLGRLLRRSKDLWRLALTTAAVLEMPGVVVLGTGAELESWAVELARGPPCASPLVAGGGSSPGGGSPLHAFAATSLGEAGPARFDDTRGSGARVRAAADALARRVRAVEDAVAAAGLEGCWDAKPALDGKAVMRAAGLTKGGPAMKAFTDRLVDWQLEHPGGGKEEAEAFVRSIAEEVKAGFKE
jgi:tRNA nucleotidyltransferase (CCA-adding enzyme)